MRREPLSNLVQSIPALTLDDAVKLCNPSVPLDADADFPMVRMRERQIDGGKEVPEGVRAIADLLEARVSFSTLFVSGRKAAERIARLSGGSIRDALRLTSDAINEQDDAPITDASVEQAIRKSVSPMALALQESRVEVLKEVAKTNRFPANCPEDVRGDMLRHLQVLAYQNGDPEPYFVVHPLLEQLKRVNG